MVHPQGHMHSADFVPVRRLHTRFHSEHKRQLTGCRIPSLSRRVREKALPVAGWPTLKRSHLPAFSRCVSSSHRSSFRQRVTFSGVPHPFAVQKGARESAASRRFSFAVHPWFGFTFVTPNGSRSAIADTDRVPGTVPSRTLSHRKGAAPTPGQANRVAH